MIEIILGEEITIVSPLLEDVCDYLFVLALLQRQCLLSGPKEFPCKFQRPLFEIRSLRPIFAVDGGLIGDIRALRDFIWEVHGAVLFVGIDGICDSKLESLISEGVWAVEGVDCFCIGDDEIIEEVILVLGPALDGLALIDLLDEPGPVLLDEEDLAGNVVLSNVLDGGRLPLLAEGRLVDPAFDLVVIFKVFFIKADAEKESIFGNGIRGGKLFSDGL